MTTSGFFEIMQKVSIHALSIPPRFGDGWKARRKGALMNAGLRYAEIKSSTNVENRICVKAKKSQEQR
jgi:hypothetical protein